MELMNRFYPAFTGWRTDFRNAHVDLDIGISSLFCMERGCHGAPDGWIGSECSSTQF